jgi:SEC-C motif
MKAPNPARCWPSELAREIVSDIALGRKPATLNSGVARPLNELFAVAGVEYHEGMIGPEGTDWEQEEADDQDQRFADGLGVDFEVARDVKLLSQQAMARWFAKKADTRDFDGLLAPADLAADPQAPLILHPETNREEFEADLARFRKLHGELFASAASLQSALARPGVAEAIAPRLELLGGPGGLSAWLELFEDINPHTTGAARASVLYLLARVTNDPGAADELLRSALALRPKFSAVFDEQIWRFGCRFDQPKLDQAFDNWIKSTGLIKQIERLDFQANPHDILRLGVLHQPKATIRNTVTAGRNDDCPCGSGKKYKKCHLGKSLPEQDPITNDSLIRSYASESLGVTSNNANPSTGGHAPSNVSTDLRNLVPRVQALQLLHLDRTQPAMVNAVVNRLTDYGPSTPGLRGDTLNAVLTMALDAATWSEEETDAFLNEVEKTGAATRWGNEIRALIRSWTSTRVSVFQVLDRAYGVQLTLRDLRNGETYVVSAPETSKNYPIDSLMFSRVVFNSRAFQFAFGTLPVPDRDRDATLAMIDAADGELKPLDVCDWVIGLRGRFGTEPAIRRLGSAQGEGSGAAQGEQAEQGAQSGAGAPGGYGDPRLRNTDSDVLAFHRCLYLAAGAGRQQDTSAELAARLNATAGFESQGDNRWDYVRPSDHNQYLIGSVEIVRASRAEAKATGVDHFLMTHTNSFKRHHELRRLLEELVGALAMHDLTADGAEDVQLGSELGLASPMPFPGGLGEQPETTAEIAAQIREQLEQRWLADSIPALGGLTPRQAAGDPTRRDDLRRLLESFITDYEEPSAALPSELTLFQMNPRNLAAELGIKLRVR